MQMNVRMIFQSLMSLESAFSDCNHNTTNISGTLSCLNLFTINHRFGHTACSRILIAPHRLQFGYWELKINFKEAGEQKQLQWFLFPLPTVLNHRVNTGLRWLLFIWEASSLVTETPYPSPSIEALLTQSFFFLYMFQGFYCHFELQINHRSSKA